METYLTQISNYLLRQSWQIALLVLIVAAVSWLLRNRSSHVRYLLWLIVLAKCLVPPLTTVPVAILPIENPAIIFEVPEITVEEPVIVASSPRPASRPPASSFIEKKPALNIQQWLSISWIAGTFLFIIIALVKAWLTNLWLRKKRRPLPNIIQTGIENLFSDIEIKTFPKVWLLGGIGQPFVWGLLRGSIYLPTDFVKINKIGQRRSILGHELIHVLRFDAAINLVQVIAQAMFWFHPFVWWANKKIRAEREKCCDEITIARLGTQTKEYSKAIVNMLISEHKHIQPVSSLAIAGPAKNIEERIKTMLKPGKKFYKHPGLITVTAILLIALLTVPTTLALTEKKTDTQTDTSESKNLQVTDIKFEPIRQGKNIVRVKVQNHSEQEQTFSVHIQTRSPEYGSNGIGWGRPFFDQVGPQENKAVRCAFQIQGPVTDSTWIRLQFYNPASVEDYDFNKWFKKDVYFCKDLTKSEINEEIVTPAIQKDSESAGLTFLQLQTLIKDKKYAQAWQMFTEDYKNAAQVETLEKFIKNMESSAYARFYWDKEQFIELKPKNVTTNNGTLILNATYKNQTWTIDFVEDDSQWKVDWIGGYTPAIIKDQPDKQRQNPESNANVELEILDVKIDPIRQGKNVVHTEVKNNSDQDQMFRIQIYTYSPGVGGWGTSFFDTIKAGQTQWTRHACKIRGLITDGTYIRLDFHNPGPAASFDMEKWNQKIGRTEFFKRVKYDSSYLEHYKVDGSQIKPASKSKADTVTNTLQQIQNHIKNKEYKAAWNLFTQDFQEAEFVFGGFEEFKRRMEVPQRYSLSGLELLALEPESVSRQNDIFVIAAEMNGNPWTIDFVLTGGQYKLDSISGLISNDWQERFLPLLEKRSTKHFDIYYFKNSTAEKEIAQIVEQKEKGFIEICQFLGTDSDVRIRMVFFEDGETKRRATGHQGMGWATGNTIVEVYNEKEKLDPYHETTHILMQPYGNPPAMFNEGFAVYMSERLGAQALKNLGGGNATIYERTKELKKNKEWINLDELITYTEIGSSQSRPPISYAEASSFVKFLIDTYGRDKFLQTYQTLQNSDEQSMHQRNAETLEKIYGQSFEHLEQKWTNAFNQI